MTPLLSAPLNGQLIATHASLPSIEAIRAQDDTKIKTTPSQPVAEGQDAAASGTQGVEGFVQAAGLGGLWNSSERYDTITLWLSFT